MSDKPSKMTTTRPISQFAKDGFSSEMLQKGLSSSNLETALGQQLKPAAPAAPAPAAPAPAAPVGGTQGGSEGSGS